MATKKLVKGSRNGSKKTPPKKRLTKAEKAAAKARAEKAAAKARSEAALRGAETRRKNAAKKAREEKKLKKLRSQAAQKGWETRRAKAEAEALATHRAQQKKRRDAIARGRSRLRGEDDVEPKPKKKTPPKLKPKKPKLKPKKKRTQVLKPGEVVLREGDTIADVLGVPELFNKNIIILKEGETAMVRASDADRERKVQRMLDAKDREIDEIRDEADRFRRLITLRHELDLFMVREEFETENGLKTLKTDTMSIELRNYISEYLVTVYETSPQTRPEAAIERRAAGAQLAEELGLSIRKIWWAYAMDIYPEKMNPGNRRTRK